jgi:transposase
MAALFSGGSVIRSRYRCSSTSKIFLGFVGGLAERANMPLVIAHNNASIHRTLVIQPTLELLEKKCVTLKFLPPCNPKLNRIERLW